MVTHATHRPWPPTDDLQLLAACLHDWAQELQAGLMLQPQEELCLPSSCAHAAGRHNCWQQDADMNLKKRDHCMHDDWGLARCRLTQHAALLLRCMAYLPPLHGVPRLVCGCHMPWYGLVLLIDMCLNMEATLCMS